MTTQMTKVVPVKPTRSSSSAIMTAQGNPRIQWLKTAKNHLVLRPRGMKGFVWDYIVDLKLDVTPDYHFEPKKGLPRILTSDVFYDLRKPLEDAGYDVTSRAAAKSKTRATIQVQYIKEICDSLEIRRADVGILAGEAGHLFYRREHYAVSLDDLDSLKLKGVIILIIEKRGISELLRYIAAKYGIALLSTQGFLTENVLDLAYLAESTGGKVAVLTDYDISGILIAYQIPEIPRIGIDIETLEDLGIADKQDELEEYYFPNPTHKKKIEDNLDDFDFGVDFDYLSERRIEINAVLKEAGGERFWEWIISKLEDEFGDDLNYNRAINIPEADEFVPDELREFNAIVINKISDILEPEQDARKRELHHYNAHIEGMIEDLSDYENGMREKFQDAVDERANMETLVNDINRLIKKHGSKTGEEDEEEKETNGQR